MQYKFDDFILDLRNFRLSRAGTEQHVEPLVFDLLCFFAENAGRLVSRVEIVETVWEGRIVSDTTVAGCIKAARKALGDSGKAQVYIRTQRGRGFQFCADVTREQPVTSPPLVLAPDSSLAEPRPQLHASPGRPTIAVLPFQVLGDPGAYGGLADAVPHEMISALSRLRWLFVIARGSSFRFGSFAKDIAEVGRALGVRYVLSGSLEVFGKKITLGVELAETASGGVLWGERFSTKPDEIHEIRGQVVASVVSTLELRITAHEALAAQLLPPENLDAWQIYHLGLKSAFSYSKEGVTAARAYFQRAIEADPLFARAHAGLSFAEFQSVFLRDAADPAASIDKARRTAERGVELDSLDPFTNFSMGRCYLLEREVGAGISWLKRAVDISPSYAQGLHATGLARVLCGQGDHAILDSKLAMELSPLDPMFWAMCGVRSFSHVARSEYTEAATWGETAANSPNAPVIASVVALIGHGLNEDVARARAWAASIRRRRPDMTKEAFFQSLPFEHTDVRQRMSKVMTRYGF